ncbi:DUF58 domain-containing protein [Halobacteriovorax sp. JY17]|uniref:DUF58 domain-containing protein n=1 Tax=Halobacteriovorax sp. JY17 TaxID=2014617 RepID=UPI000C5BB312|nr:DUF58 domain-containing protein [Halobacteriovorax sp. JY17]PIK15374.1 MAG: hypothetical protein CES88_01270 [Halobacteriovorax sp. JY17]
MKSPSSRTYIIPTGLGFILGIIIFLAFIIAVTFGHPFSYFITFFSVAIVIVCAFHTNYSIARLKTFYFRDEFIESGKECEISFEVSSKEVISAKAVFTRVDGSKKVRYSVISRESSRLRSIIYRDRCGVFKTPRIRIHTTYPLGLFRAWKYVEAKNNLIVYPKRISGHESYSDTNIIQHSDTVFRQNLETKEEFLDHRRFRETDSWKHIDWKAYARGKGLLTKNFSGNESVVVTLEVRSSSSLDVLGLVTEELFRNYELSKDTIFVLDDEVISRGGNQLHLHKCLRVLSLLGGNRE